MCHWLGCYRCPFRFTRCFMVGQSSLQNYFLARKHKTLETRCESLPIARVRGHRSALLSSKAPASNSKEAPEFD
jgi:hypothetical protein